LGSSRALAAACALAACGGGGATPETGPPSVVYTDVTASSGVDFVHENGMFGRKFFPETVGSGLALFDADGDGRLDLLFVNQRRWSGHEEEYREPPSRRPTLRLYRNRGGWKFEDVTEAAGLDVECFGMGTAVADVEGDGDADLVVTALGDLLFFRNEGGRFVERAREAGLVTPRWGHRGTPEHPMWGTSAAFLDFDRDGVLDLFVCGYIRWCEETEIFTSYDGVTKVFTTPDLYPGESSRLFRGLGGGRYEDMTEAAGVHHPRGKSLGVAVADVNDDGWPDVVVANDTQPNDLYLNEGGCFRDVALEAGVGVDPNGKARAGMGVDVGLLSGEERQTIAIGNFSHEGTSLYREARVLAFVDEAGTAGLARATRLSLTFGLLFLDFDLDGRLDLALANGHIEPDIRKTVPDVTYAQPPQLFWNDGGSRFLDVSQAAGFTRPLVGRGLAAGDLDDDGDLDLVFTQNGGPPALYRCDRSGAAARNRFLQVRLVGREKNRDAIGSVLRARIGDRVLERWVRSGSSYLSQGELTATFGLGAADRVDRLEVRWPTGKESAVERVEASPPVLVLEEP
jgi:hypothetical protein